MDKRIIVEYQKKFIKTNLPEFSVGDLVRVHARIIEGEKQRIQLFEGTVIARRGSGAGEAFTVRHLSYGEGVERTFLLHSPFIERIEVLRKGKVKRAKLYYLRKKVGKKTKIEEESATKQEEASDASSGKKGKETGV